MSHFSLRFMAAVGLALSIGWGIRGNFGHENGAMIPGALAAMAAALLSGREDWQRRVPLFGFFGAIGWSFGGSISYMQVIGYTHSGDSVSVFYGFACLFVIGFLWAATGGAATAMPAVLSRARLDSLLPAIIAVFVGWVLQDIVLDRLAFDDSAFRHENPLYWYDTDWVGAAMAIFSLIVFAAIRRNWDEGCWLIFYMAVGWWVGFLLLVNLLGLRMTPPRGDNWAGILGMVAGLWIFLWKRREREILWASLCAGFWGGFGFAFATLLKLIEVKSGWITNWHSVLEQSYGFINGIGIAMMMWIFRIRVPLVDDTRAKLWVDKFAIVFVLLAVTYLNLDKNPSDWVKARAVPSEMYSIRTEIWFAGAYVALLVAMLWIVRKRPAFVPATALGRGQLFLLIFLWWMVIGNFERAVVGFAPQRLITEGVIFLNAVVLTMLVVVPMIAPKIQPAQISLQRISAIGLAMILLTTVGSWGIVRAIYGDTFAGHANLHIRFGPNGPAAGPKPGQAHP